MTSNNDRVDSEQLISALKSKLKDHQNITSKLNDKNQEIFDKETRYFGYMNKANTSSTTSTFTSFTQSFSNNNNTSNDGPSYNSYGNIIKGFEGFVKNSIALGSGLNTGNTISPQILQQVDKERDFALINTLVELSQKSGKGNASLSPEKVVKSYLEKYFEELPDLNTEEEKEILLNYYGKLKGNFGMDNGFDNGYINKNLYTLLKQRQFIGNGNNDASNTGSVRSGRNNPASLGLPTKQDVEALVFSVQAESDDEVENVDRCELKDEDRIFSLSNAEYRNLEDAY